MDPQQQAPVNTGIHEFELVDARGKSHRYSVTEHPAGEGMEIMFALLSMGAPTVLGLAGAAVQSERLLGMVIEAFSTESDGTPPSREDFGDLAKLAVGIDLPSVGRELGVALAGGKAPQLTRKILSRVNRDGQFLRNEAAFDMAFQANYLELLVLIFRVCSINRFFPVPGTLLDSPQGTGTTGTIPTQQQPGI